MKALSLAAVAALIVAAPAAQASVIATLTGVTPVGSDYRFSYEGQLAPDQGVKAGDQLVIVDFKGYVPGSVTSLLTDVSASVANTLPTDMLLPPGVTDSASIPDLIFTYTGPNFHTSGGPFGGDTNFTGLSALSTYGGVAPGYFSAKAVKNNGRETGSTAYNVGSVGVPGVPEPASWTLMVLGIGAIGAGLRLSRGRSSTSLSRA